MKTILLLIVLTLTSCGTTKQNTFNWNKSIKDTLYELQ